MNKTLVTLMVALGEVGFAALVGIGTYKSYDVLSDPDLTVGEKIKESWKNYIPAAVEGGALAAAIITDKAIDTNTIKNLKGTISAQKILLDTVNEQAESYSEIISEKIGPKKEKELKGEAVGKTFKKGRMSPENINPSITICYDLLSRQEFNCPIERIHQAEREIKERLKYRSFVPMNEFYLLININTTDFGDFLGWNSRDGIALQYTSYLLDDGTPCLLIGHKVAPRYEK